MRVLEEEERVVNMLNKLKQHGKIMGHGDRGRTFLLSNEIFPTQIFLFR